MRAFWDRRAREEALFYIDNRLDYRRPDPGRFWAGGAADLDELLERGGAQLRRSDSVVEVGCGVGRLTRPMAARVADVRALDVSGEMLALARELNPTLDNVTWLEGDGVSLTGIDDESADACISHVTFQHIPDPGVTLGYIREIGRILRPGGWAVFQVSNDPAVHRPRRGGRLRRTMRIMLRRAPRGQSHPAWLGSAVDLSELELAARDGGMEIERVVGAGTQFCIVGARRR